MEPDPSQAESDADLFEPPRVVDGLTRPDGSPAVVMQVLPRLVAGGVERGTVDMAQALAAAGATALVASAGGPMEAHLKRFNAQHITHPLASKNPFVIRRNIDRLAEIITRYKVDIVHARSRAPAWSAYWAAQKTGCHFITTTHAPYGAANALKRRYNSVMTKGERVIAISEFVADYLRRTYAVDPARIRIVHRGVDLLRFDPGKITSERVIKLAQQWRMPDGVPLILLPGRLTRWKGQAVLLEAVSRLKGLDLCCALLGSDLGREGYRQELEKMITDKGLTGRAFILENCDDMPAAYKLADVVVSASSEPEGFGRVVSESQAMGRLTIVSNHGGAKEQIIDGRTALSFTPDDPDSLAKAIVRALSLSAEDRDLMQSRAVQHVRDNFSNEVMCRKTIGLYRELLRADAYAPAS
ncbi:MAG: glycosyltransferase family 4 protein [Pseudomonadota bacterium]